MTQLEPLKIQPIYHPSKEDTWTGVNWSKVEKTVENSTELLKQQNVGNTER
jgi:hypothetical protein